MKVLTWNINGIRGNKGLPLKQLLDSLDADIICLQETKVTRKIVLQRIQFTLIRNRGLPCFCSALLLLCSALVLLCFCSALLLFCFAFVLLCFRSALLSSCSAVVLLWFTFCHYHSGCCQVKPQFTS